MQGQEPPPRKRGPIDTRALLAWERARGLAWPALPYEGGALGAGGPSEATSLQQLFSMALATADKPYQLIFPSHRQTESARTNGTLELRWRAALLVRKGDPRGCTTVCHPGTDSSTDHKHR